MSEEAVNKIPMMAYADDRGSWLSLFNPLSYMVGGKDRYPEFMGNIFGPKTGYLISKGAAQLLLGAAIAGGARAIRNSHFTDKVFSPDTPVGKVTGHGGTTFSLSMVPQGAEEAHEKKETKAQKNKNKKTDNKKKPLKKTAQKTDAARSIALDREAFSVPRPLAGDLGDSILSTALPVTALALGLAGGYTLVNKAAVAHEKSRLRSGIADKRNALNALILARARLAKGTATDAEVKKALNAAMEAGAVIKTAAMHMTKCAQTKPATTQDTKPDTSPNGNKEAEPTLAQQIAYIVTSGGGTLAIGLLAASALAAHEYFKRSDIDNLEYRAAEEGIKAYTKAKSDMTPVTLLPPDMSKFVAAVEGRKPQAAAPASAAKPLLPASQELQGQAMRNLPEQEATRRPISITL